MPIWKGYVLSICFLLLRVCDISYAQSNAGTTNNPFLPPAWPLAVKGPYFNSWQPGGQSTFSLPASSPAFWPAWDDQTTWTCMVVVDDKPYGIMASIPNGPPDVTVATQTAISFSATKTVFVFEAGPVNVNASFLSTVTPTDLVRQSLPFAYLYLDISSTDGNAHNIRVYSDITPPWLHGNEVLLPDPDPKVAANASLNELNEYVGLQMQLQVPHPFLEVAEHAQDVIGVFAINSSPGVKYQVGESLTVRNLGTNSTGLQNTIDTNYPTHALDDPFDAYALTIDLGVIEMTSEPIVFTVGMLRDPSINLTTASGTNQLRSSYYWSNFSTIPHILSFVLDDFETARQSGEAFDEMIQNISLANIEGYTDLLSLAARQIFGTLEITVSKASDGSWNQSDVMIFSKNMGDIGSFGTSGGTNTVDVLYAGLPALLYTNPSLALYLIRPILESQINDGVLIGQGYAPQNLGTQFPNVTTDNSAHNLGIEQSGNMLIMVLSIFQRTGDQSLIQNYYSLLKSWADYLVDQTLDAGFQTTSLSDGITSFNQTNLVLKGIIGISAMGQISSAMNESADEMHYQATAQEYMNIWVSGAVSQDRSHLLSSFANEASSGLIYNMYADKLLGLNLIPSNVTSIQAAFYESLLNAKRTPFGIPLDSSDSSLSRLDWTMFAITGVLNEGDENAALILHPAISMLKNYVAAETYNSSFAVVYNPQNGMPISGSNSFAIGSLFAPLVIETKSKPGALPGQDSSSSQKFPIQKIVGGVVGGVIAVLLLILGIRAWRRISRQTVVTPLNDPPLTGSRLRNRGPFKFKGTPSDEVWRIAPFLVDASSASSAQATPTAASKEDDLAARNPPIEGISSELPPAESSTRRLDKRLADMLREVRMVRNAVRNRNVRREVGGRNGRPTEAPPSYASMPLMDLSRDPD
ncbi:hypothetical protein SCHPADRAFT_938386 [Schizopora paradoxa]|uniref:DUF1793-domain-containing protein n=1 Tax=Schizopora paradoxa TaxID=27342 RepID=A0A0H2RUT4_9AGAM|nr:hypothetical protein SCHPADRAFT_938386 [Schizopora paradoxa]